MGLWPPGRRAALPDGLLTPPEATSTPAPGPDVGQHHIPVGVCVLLGRLSFGREVILLSHTQKRESLNRNNQCSGKRHLVFVTKFQLRWKTNRIIRVKPIIKAH